MCFCLLLRVHPSMEGQIALACYDLFSTSLFRLRRMFVGGLSLLLRCCRWSRRWSAIARRRVCGKSAATGKSARCRVFGSSITTAAGTVTVKAQLDREDGVRSESVVYHRACVVSPCLSPSVVFLKIYFSCASTSKLSVFLQFGEADTL